MLYLNERLTDSTILFRSISVSPFSVVSSVSLLAHSEELKRFAVILLRIEITHLFVYNGDCTVTGPSEMNPLEMLENENEPQTVLISNPGGNLEPLTTICAFENLKLANFYE